MTQIPFEHEGCDCWGIYESQYIDAEISNNMHVVECRNSGEKSITPNNELETVCGQKLNRGNRKHSGKFIDASEIRLKLAQLQNQGNEVCGTCVSHFYADPEP